MRSLTAEIKEKARELGFCEIGIARAGRLDEGNRLAEWLGRGYHGTMEWMARNFEKRVDPRNILPDAKSVISVAMNYYSDVQHSSDPETGKISRYAWGDDYHDVLKERLEQLSAFIRSRKQDVRTRAYADTGPMLDKAWAQRAGIGWEGKHTNVITKEYGSWVFLGEIILSIELDYDPPATDHCGSCTLCIEACPTGAIVEPYVVDSNLCISYLTIEHRGEIDEQLAGKFDNWIYGCDVCQDVCPWNKKFAKPTSAREFCPHPHNVAPRLQDVAKMQPAEFTQQFRKSAVKRTKHSGFLRTVHAVMKHSKELIP